MRYKQTISSLVSIYFDSHQLGHTVKIKLCKNLYYWSREKLNFDFLERGLEIVSPPSFVYDISRKIFLILHSINWPNFMV